MEDDRRPKEGPDFWALAMICGDDRRPKESDFWALAMTRGVPESFPLHVEAVLVGVESGTQKKI